MTDVTAATHTPIDPTSFLSPLDFILDDHRRQHEICERLKKLTAEPAIGSAQEAQSLLDFLTHDFVWHAQDEERDLFPALVMRSIPDDRIEDVLLQLAAEHELDEELVGYIVSDLQLIAHGAKTEMPTRMLINVRAFAELQQRHLAWENRIVMPLARERLTAVDLETMGRSMAARRSIPYPV